MRPDFCIVEDVPSILLGLLGSHDLDKERPDGVIATFDSVPHVNRVIVGLDTRKSMSLSI
jgi:hypothetical protein